MNRAEYDKQLAQFTDLSAKAGRMLPDRCTAVLDEDGSSHTEKEYSWPYLAHCAWAARMLAKNKPQRHADFGSYVYFAAMCSAFVPCFEFYDIRAFGMKIPGLETGIADLTKLPFPDGSIESVSCLHVLEHIGLARYGDTLDPDGHMKAAKELVRVLAPGGKLLIVLPMCETPYIAFNAHRMLSLGMMTDMFSPLRVTFESFLFDKRFLCTLPLRDGDEYTGCFEFTK